jgi:cyanate permease
VPLITWLIQTYQWRATLIILGVGFILIGTPLSIFCLREPKTPILHSNAVGKLLPKDTTESDDQKMPFIDALRNRAFWQIGLAETFRLMILAAVITHIIPYLSSIGFSRKSAAYIAAVIPILSIFGRIGFGWLCDIFTTKYVAASAYALSAIGLFAFSYARITWFMVIFILFFSISWGGGALRGAIVVDYFGTVSLGRLLGIMAGVGTGARILGAPLAGWTYDSLGTYQPIWLVFTAVMIIATGFILTMKRPNLCYS